MTFRGRLRLTPFKRY